MENTIHPEIEENGNVNIADEVVSIIASLAAAEVKGVASMGSTISGGFAELLGKKNLSKGVKLSVDDKNVVLDLSIIVEYGAKIPDVAWELQEKVKSEVESMTGLTVTAVNISVDGVNVPKSEKEEAEAEETLEVEDLAAEETVCAETAEEAAESAEEENQETTEE